jgi:integrase
MTAWIERWRDWIAVEPTLPGVWARRDGGFHVRGRVRDPRTRRRLEVNHALPDVTRARDALRWLEAEMARRRADGGGTAPVQIPRFDAYAVQVFERKIDLGRIRSAAGRSKWASIIATHLIPSFGTLYVDQIRPSDVKAWQSKVAARIQGGELSPTTANTALAVLRQILGEAVDDYDMRDPMRGVAPFDTREHDPYSEESPNSLAPADVPRFLEAMRELHPQHYAFTFLGFTTGLRPSSLRPLRRGGPDADVKWDKNILLVRRSHTMGAEVMETTKTDRHQRIHMPKPLTDVLRWHVNEQLLPRKMRESELLFPAVTGGLRARSCLDKPFAEVGAAIGLPYSVTPRAMRRTFQDLSRAAGVADLVTRAISGHATEAMQHHYSTVAASEIRAGLAKVIDIATARRAR